jgi:MHS family alpha-ketoglutarate permease-like MFS transporter
VKSEIRVHISTGFGSSCGWLTLVFLIVLQQTLSEEAMYAWGRRVPFFIGPAASLVVLYLRRTMDESTHFEAEKQADRKAAESGQKIRKVLSALIREYPVQLFVVIALAINTSGISKSAASVIIFCALSCSCACSRSPATPLTATSSCRSRTGGGCSPAAATATR